jgi:Holliday junction resolvase RusA-like endonuclease
MLFETFIPFLPKAWKVQRSRFIFYNVNQAYIDEVKRFIVERFLFPPSDKPIALEFVHILPFPQTIRKKILKNKFHEEIFHTKRPDTTNLNKQMEDCLTGIVFIDDKQVIEISGKKIYGLVVGTEVRVYERG